MVTCQLLIFTWFNIIWIFVRTIFTTGHKQEKIKYREHFATFKLLAVVFWKKLYVPNSQNVRQNSKADTNQQSQQMNMPYQTLQQDDWVCFVLCDFGSIHITLHNTLISLHHTINRKGAYTHNIFTHTYQSNNNGKPFQVIQVLAQNFCFVLLSLQTKKRQIVSGISNTNVENYAVDTFDCVTFERRLKSYARNK